MRFLPLALTSLTLFAQERRDWQSSPAVVQIDTANDIYAVGDAHGDLARLSAVLAGAKIIAAPSSPAWTAGKSVVVFTGDLIDKGAQSLGVISMVRALQAGALEAGGRVAVTMGNHEAEFLANPAGEKTAEFAAELSAAGMNPSEVASCQGDLGAFLCALPFAARVNDWFFSHGGNTDGRTLTQLTNDLQNGVDREGFQTADLIGPNSILEARLGDSPWCEPNGADAKATLSAYAKALGVSHIVQGHQPGHVQFADGVKRKSGEMFQRFGLLFLEDTGMSAGVEDSHGAVLHIFTRKKKNSAAAVCFNGAATVIWDSKKQQAVGRIPPCGGK